MPVRFGEFTFDEEARQLRLEDRLVHVSPKAFDLLRHLLRVRPQALSKAELLARIWPRTHVTEGSLASVVAELRAALYDRKTEPRFIRTVHSFGYAFCGEAVAMRPPGRESQEGVAYRLIWRRREIQLSEGENVLGRDREAVVWVDSSEVSRRHARIVISGDQATLEDLGSRNGTFLRGQRLSGTVVLADHDEIHLGSVVMTFRVFPLATTESGQA